MSRFWVTADGWVRTHGNYPHHAAALLGALSLPADASAAEIGAVLAQTRAADAASRITARGGLCTPVRRERPGADAELRRDPLFELTRWGDAPRRPLHPAPGLPLHGVRVLDLTRVIAGPVATRTLAFAGADVLRIDPPRRPEVGWQHLDTGHGKRSALLDVADDPTRLEQLLKDADVIVLGYRPEGLARLGLSPAALALRHPHLVIAQLSAWPGDRSARGFDSIVQADSGISWISSVDGSAPGALPAQALDHSAGYLLAAGVAAALDRRATSGGTWSVRTSLRRVAAELLGLPRGQARASTGSERVAAPDTQTFEVAGQIVTTVRPAVRWPGSPAGFAAPRTWGADPAEW